MWAIDIIDPLSIYLRIWSHPHRHLGVQEYSKMYKWTISCGFIVLCLPWARHQYRHDLKLSYITYFQCYRLILVQSKWAINTSVYDSLFVFTRVAVATKSWSSKVISMVPWPWDSHFLEDILLLLSQKPDFIHLLEFLVHFCKSKQHRLSCKPILLIWAVSNLGCVVYMICDWGKAIPVPAQPHV